MKKIICIYLVIFLLTNVSFAKEYSDLSPNHWAYGVMNEMVRKGIFSGYDDGTMRPDKTISRAEFAKLLVKTFELEKYSETYREFKDVNKSHWAYDYIEIAQDYMITYTTTPLTIDLSDCEDNVKVKITLDGQTYTDYPPQIRKIIEEYNERNVGPKFYPDKPLTRECAGHDIVRAVYKYLRVLEPNESVLDIFTDKDEISDITKAELAIAIEKSLMKGVGDGKFNPQGNLTRAQAAQLINNALYIVKQNEHGSCSDISGKTVVVSIFADDLYYSWNYDSSKDVKAMKKSLEDIGKATQFLTKNVRRYGKEPVFVYDWSNNEDLIYNAQFSEVMVSNNLENYDIERSWIKEHINESKLKANYGADNVIYIIIFNTDYGNDINSHCWQSDYPDVEMVNIFLKGGGDKVEASVYVHEMLHAFGAPDLYESSSLITQEYVDYLERIDSDDIMRGSLLDGLLNETFSEIDAYYVGLLSDCNTRIKWNLGLSEYSK